MHLQWFEIAQILAILENSRLITFMFSFGVILGPKTSLVFNMCVLAQVFVSKYLTKVVTLSVHCSNIRCNFKNRLVHSDAFSTILVYLV